MTDAPCANFTNELTAAFPKAKVILTTRDPDSWVRSMNSSYYRVLDILQWWNPLVHYDPVCFSFVLRFMNTHKKIELLGCIWKAHSDNSAGVDFW